MNEEHVNLLKAQYGFTPTNSWHGLRDGDYWLYYQFDYKLASTRLLLKLLRELSGRGYNYSHYDVDYSKYIKIANGLKKILNTREHIPNKKERDIIRKEKFKYKND